MISYVLLRRAYEVIGAFLEMIGPNCPVELADAAKRLMTDIFEAINRKD